ncbi:MAG TPA: pyridoxal phosphate-dependent aminotransferase family protein [Bacteroidales bacterium]|nr:pyridoxal phosphate-dependent aminotransferase family protein [Bacteroidales bacterium]
MILLNSDIGNYVISNGRRFSYFGGNNYLGLASHPEVKEASIRAIEKYGVNFSASRRTSGTADIHLELEKRLSGFKGSENTVVFSSGYQGNGILLEVLKEKYSTLFIEQYAHASIRSAVHSEKKEAIFYNHCDAEHLESLLFQHKNISALIITDGIFPLTGEIAPLDKIYNLAKKYNAVLVVDDAHATGVIGKSGKGTPEYFNLPEDDNLFQSETMSKALGSYGGFISGTRSFTENIRERSATYQASTSLPPSVVAAGIAALRIIDENRDLQAGLLKKADNMRAMIRNQGFKTTDSITPIIPLMFSDELTARRLSSYLEENGFIVPYMNYPSEKQQYLIRIAVSVLHTEEQISELSGVLDKWKSRT